MLRNPVYSGWVEVPDWSVRYRGAFESIVSDEVFDMVQAVLSGRRPVVAPYSRNSPEFPLRRFVRCGRCGTALTASFSTGRKRVRHPYYHCRKRGCGGVSVRRADIEQQFVNLLDAVRPKPEYLRLFKAVVLDVWKEKEAEAAALCRAADRRLQELEKKKKSLIDAFVYRHAIAEDVYASENSRLDEEITVARIEANEAKWDHFDVESVLAFAEYVLSHASRLWMEFNLDQKQRLQRVLFPNGLTYEKGQFGTAATNTIFTQLRLVGSEENQVASPTGFEPVLPP
jgi:site-specific DNA recombinase